MKKVALVTESRFLAADTADDWYINQAVAEDQFVASALRARGIEPQLVDWLDVHVDWGRFDAAIIRAVWNYNDDLPRFRDTLSRIAVSTRLVNPADLVRWNLDKHYLAELGARGVSVIPTRYVACGTATTLAQIMAETGWGDVCIKPAISAGARHTHRLTVTRDSSVPPSIEAVFQEVLAVEDWMVQPFQTSVPTLGERTFMVFGGRCTHAVLKTPAAGDFRVQDDHGGTVVAHPLTPTERAFAEGVVARCPELPVYARVDAVIANDGALALMELELIEPELFFRFQPSAADALVDALLGPRPGRDDSA
jgi:glutathione synthase/RimK-type ligase-like ATP-grasp enzyme